MAAEQDALRRQIVGKREEIADDVARLQWQIRHTYSSVTDWQGFLRRRPLILVGAGFGLGLIAGLTLGGLFDERA